MGKIPPKTWENCRGPSERKSGAHSYDDLVDLLIEMAMEREKHSHMDDYLRKHLQSETPTKKAPGGRLPEPQSNPGKGRGGHLKHMRPPPPRVKGPLIFSTVVLRTIRVEDEGPQPPPLVHPTPHLRVNSRVKTGLCPPSPALVAPTRAARTPRSATSTGTLIASRPLGLQ